jgi:hypothetical protein
MTTKEMIDTMGKNRQDIFFESASGLVLATFADFFAMVFLPSEPGEVSRDRRQARGHDAGDIQDDWPLIFRMMAPSTMRSRKAIAHGGSPRYSPQASKSMLVTSAVDRCWLLASTIF